MPVASGTARTRFGLGGGIARRAGSFSGKSESIGTSGVVRESLKARAIVRDLKARGIVRGLKARAIVRDLKA